MMSPVFNSTSSVSAMQVIIIIDLKEDHSKKASVAQSQDCVLVCILGGLACTVLCSNFDCSHLFLSRCCVCCKQLVKVFATTVIVLILPKIS